MKFISLKGVNSLRPNESKLIKFWPEKYRDLNDYVTRFTVDTHSVVTMYASFSFDNNFNGNRVCSVRKNGSLLDVMTNLAPIGIIKDRLSNSFMFECFPGDYFEFFATNSTSPEWGNLNVCVEVAIKIEEL